MKECRPKERPRIFKFITRPTMSKEEMVYRRNYTNSQYCVELMLASYLSQTPHLPVFWIFCLKTQTITLSLCERYLGLDKSEREKKLQDCSHLMSEKIQSLKQQIEKKKRRKHGG
ncbi:hypothetical protein AMTRI_Chr04g251810 [Amborella trichopoda]